MRPKGRPNKIAGRVAALIDGAWVHVEIRKQAKGEPGAIYLRQFRRRKNAEKRLSFADAWHTANGQKLLL